MSITRETAFLSDLPRWKHKSFRKREESNHSAADGTWFVEIMKRGGRVKLRQYFSCPSVKGVAGFRCFGLNKWQLITGDRQSDLKDERRRAQMTAARLVLERSTMMLLTSSKVSNELEVELRSPRHRLSSSASHRFILAPTDKSETSRMYIFQREPWYGVLPNEKGYGLNSLRRQGWRARDIKRSKRIETSKLGTLSTKSRRTGLEHFAWQKCRFEASTTLIKSPSPHDSDSSSPI